jgi:pyruvate/2-oxoglutarate dehydrogenase complex dihydrolipoamide dehydrogenase (E3) component
MTERHRYDVIVLGAGSTGTNVAWYARDNGLDVAVVEPALVGGECSYWACIPSKALLGPVNAVAAARRVPGTDVRPEVDVDAVLSRRDALVKHLDDASAAEWLEGIGADLVRGHGRIVGEREVEVTDADGATRRLSAERAVVVATGSRAARPPIEGLDDVGAWDNREVTTAEAVPDRLIVLGGGVVGCEMAQAYRRLGASEVTIVEMADRILVPYDPWVSELLTEALGADGVRVLTGRAGERVSRDGDTGPVTLTLDDGSSITGDEFLVATGRSPNTDDIGLDAVGLEPGGPLEVDDQLRVPGIDWLHAAGDVNGRALLTHQGKYQGRLIGDIVAGEERSAWADHRAVPQVMFTDPEVASVGLTEQAARDEDRTVEVVTVDMDAVAATTLTGGSGRAQLVIDRDRSVVVGATFVGPQAGELLHAATIAVVGEVPLDILWHAVPAFPTVSEIWLRLLEAHRDLIQ